MPGSITPVSHRFPIASRQSPLMMGIGLLVAMAWAVSATEPWVGELGVTETTAQIMDRQEGYQRPPRVPWRVPRHRPRGRVNFGNLLTAADAPPLTGNEAQAGPAPTAFSTGLSFTGATLSDTSAFPPDSMGAVGPVQYIVAVNGRIRSFNKTNGVADGVLNVNPDVFFNSVLTPPVDNNFTSDPRIRYDRLSGRWFLIIIDVPQQTGTFPNRILFAVSDGAVITPSSAWTFFQFQHDLPAPASNSDTGKFADYPTLGIDANALYIGVNLFGTRGQGSFSSTTAYVVRKSSLLGAGPIVVTPFRDLIEGNPNVSGPYTPQGVDNHDPAATEGYFIGVDASYYGRLKLRRVSDPGGSPSLSPNITITVPATGGTITVPHLGNANGTAGHLDGLDYRLLAAHIRNGKLWTAANLAVDNTGSPSGTDTRLGIRWYELGGIATGQTPSVLQAGTLFQPSGANTMDQRSYWMGSIMVSGQGHALLGFSAAGANEYANAGFAVRLAGDATGTMRTPVLYTTSTSAYNPPSNPGTLSRPRRWGDYSYTSLDPDDDMTMWTVQEWCHAPNSYAVQVVKVLAPPPATPFSVTPASITRGQANVNLTVLGSVTDGSGFFDPGSGFPNRISAAIAGSGVTVNNITYNGPTNLTLNVSVAGNAPLGARAITVTNPDGQSAASVGGLLNILDTGSNSPPSLTLISNQIVDEGILLTFVASGSDPDGPITYSLDPGAPAGASIDAGTGVFTWTPTEAQGPASNSITVRVTDAGVPPLDASRTFTVTVNEVNLAPGVAAVSNRVVHAGTVLVITNVATDLDLPANQLTFSLDPGAPLGAGVNPASGVFTWATTEADAPSTNAVTVRVTDDGVAPLDGSAAFSIVVVPGPEVRAIMMTNSQVTLLWNAIIGQTYRVQYKLELSDPSWLDLAGDVAATADTATKADDATGADKRFYRVTLRY